MEQTTKRKRPTKRAPAKKRSTLNNQSNLEKFLKSRRVFIILLCAVSLLQTPHTAYVIKELTFIEGSSSGWIHSTLLALCLEIFIIIFSIQNLEKLARMYLIFAIGVNFAMSAFHHSDNYFHLLIYFLITSIFPLSTFFVADVLSKGFKKQK